MQFLFANDPAILNVIHFGPFEYYDKKNKEKQRKTKKKRKQIGNIINSNKGGVLN